MADKVATDFISKVKAKGKQAMSWFRDIVKKTRAAAFPAATGRADIMDDRNTGVQATPTIGRLYLFQYNAKWKDILPYWDVWPLIFPFDFAANGFYGINLHYLNPTHRLNLMRALMRASGSKGNLDDPFFRKGGEGAYRGFPPPSH